MKKIKTKMKRLLFFLTAFAFFSVLPSSADNTQVLVVNGETVEKVVTRMTFEGDNVILTFVDNSTQTADMGSVTLSFGSLSSINDLKAFQLKKVVNGQISLEGLEKGTEVFIYDTAGKQIARSKSTNINVSKLKEGVYVLKAGTQLVKFVKH